MLYRQGQEKIRWAGESTLIFELSIISSLPKRDVIMKSKNYKRNLERVFSTFNAGENLMMQTRDDEEFDHDESDITMISYVTEAANSAKNVVRVLSNNTGVLVLLVYWVCRKELQCKVQMDWSGGMGQCSLPMPPALTWATVSVAGGHACPQRVRYGFFPYALGKSNALNTLLAWDLPGLDNVMREVGVTQEIS